MELDEDASVEQMVDRVAITSDSDEEDEGDEEDEEDEEEEEEEDEEGTSGGAQQRGRRPSPHEAEMLRTKHAIAALVRRELPRAIAAHEANKAVSIINLYLIRGRNK
jgi:FtsZ-interacting cell division protein YlmF